MKNLYCITASIDNDEKGVKYASRGVLWLIVIV